jgi:hypothetical protein
MPAAPTGTIVCNVGALAPDVLMVGALARLQLAARGVGLELRFRHASIELQELVTFVGLEDVLCVEPERQPEQREERLGVEEERELDDPPA